MKRNIKYLLFIAGLLLGHLTVSAQSKVTVASTVTDEAGSPVANATVYGNQGAVIVVTNATGAFSILVDDDSPLLIEAKGYESKQIDVLATIGDAIIIEQKAYGLRAADEVSLPFGSTKSRYVTGDVTTLNADELLKTDASQSIYGAINGRVSGVFGNRDIRGLGNAVVIVDGLPRNTTFSFMDEIGQLLDLGEVEKITVLKDASSRLLYGSIANDGVILIETKRGKANKKVMNVRAEYGFATPKSLPSFLSAADYMELYNEALANDGKGAKYSPEQIASTRAGTDPIRYPDVDYYNSDYLKKSATTKRIFADAAGGSDKAQYYTSLSWDRWSGMYNLGDDETRDRIKVRGNVDYAINNWMSMKLDALVVFQKYTGPDMNFWGNAATYLPNTSPVLIDTTDLPYSDDLKQSAVIFDGKYILGGTSEYPNNIYGDFMYKGYQDDVTLNTMFNTGLDLNLGFITEGLTAKAYLSFDMYNHFNAAYNNTYAVYQPVYGVDTDGNDSLYLTKIGTDEPNNSQSINRDNDMHASRRIGFYGVINYDRTFGDHHFEVDGVGYRMEQSRSAQIQKDKYLHFGVRFNYAFQDKYILNLSAAIPGSPKFGDEGRWGFSPSIGAGWILSEEDFLSSSNLIDYLKLRASYSIISTDDNFGQYYGTKTIYANQGGTANRFDYENSSTLANNSWVGKSNNNTNNINYLANPDLSWEKLRDITIGIDAVLANSFFVDASYFNMHTYDKIVQLDNNYPSLLGQSYMYENFESNKRQGVEFGINYKNHSNEFRYNVGVNLAYASTEAVDVNELNYTAVYEHLKKSGQPVDAIFGLEADGLYGVDDFNADGSLKDGIPVPQFGPVQPGDIKYVNKDGNNIIDDNDMTVIGNYKENVYYGINVTLGYKNFDLFILGTGEMGGESLYNNQYYWVYGERKYSDVVLDRYSPDNQDVNASYPRLSSSLNSNNYRNSSYWLEKDDRFSLNTVQLTYNFDRVLANRMFMQGLGIYVRANNLLTISKTADKLELNTAGQPQMRYFGFGLQATF